MKKIPFYLLLGSSIILSSCSKKEKNNEEISEVILQKNDTISAKDTAKTIQLFDINTITVSTFELGEFPYLELPKNIQYQNKPINRDYDDLYFPIGKNGDFEKLSGKVFKTYVVKSDDATTDWSFPYFLKTYDDAIKKLGGVMLLDKKLTDQQTNYLKNNARYLGEEGSLDYWNDPVQVYVIRRTNGDDIYIQLSGNSAGGSIQILQKEITK